MLSPKAPLLRDVLEEHLEELAFLWGLRRDGILSPGLTRGDLALLEARIEAHAEGLLVARGELLDLAGPLLGSDEPEAAFAAGYVLLRSGREGAGAVVEAFRSSSGGGRQGLADALAHGDARDVREELAACAASEDACLALAASAALALQRASGLPERLEDRFLADADPAIRAAAWRLAPFLREAPRAEAVARALADPDSGVALEAAVAAAWFALPSALEASRAGVRRGGAEAAPWLRLLAVLGDATDLAPVLAAAGDRAGAGSGAAGPRAFGALGHPRGVEPLLAAMADEDPVRAAAAGAAFRKVTGFDATGERRAAVGGAAAAGGDEADEPPSEEVALPDVEGARAFWDGARGAFGGGVRWCHGVDVSAGCPGELPDALDQESRWELRLRGRFTGAWKGDAAGLFRMSPASG